MTRVLSLGAGVQSSTLALMAVRGDIEPPAFAVFADTGAEPRAVYEWLDWLETQLPYPVYRAAYGNLRADSTETRVSKKSGRRYWRSLVPTFVKKETGAKGMLTRKCTRDYKINVIYREIAKRLALSRADKRQACVTQLIWISTDESHRQASPYKKWVRNEYPLIQHSMSREDCLTWMAAHGYPQPPRSACTFCPYHSDQEWSRLKTNDPAAFADAVQYEQEIQQAAAQCTTTLGIPFLHVSLTPLDQVKFANADPHAEFSSECEGMCGL